MVSILAISHSKYFAKAAVDLVLELKTANFKLEWIGGREGDEDFGTDPMEIQLKMQEMDDGDGVLVICDMGSSVMHARLAKSFLSEDVQKRILISKGPFFESLLQSVDYNRPGVSVEKLYEISNTTIGKEKY